MYKARKKDKLNVKRVNTTLKHMSINNICVKLCNNLDREIRDSVSLNVLKKLKHKFLQAC